MKRKSGQLARLKSLQAEIDALRKVLRISAPGEVLYSSPLRALEDKEVVVEADGLGGATTSVVEGNYPVDYFTDFEKHFSSEDEAIIAADDLVEGRSSKTFLSACT